MSAAHCTQTPVDEQMGICWVVEQLVFDVHCTHTCSVVEQYGRGSRQLASEVHERWHVLFTQVWPVAQSVAWTHCTHIPVATSHAGRPKAPWQFVFPTH